MSILIEKCALGVSLDHPLVDNGSLSATIQHFIDIVPGHCVYFSLKLMLHLLVLIFRLFGENWDVGGHVPPFYHEIAAAGDQHIVFTVINVYHIQHHIFVLGNHQILFYHFF